MYNLSFIYHNSSCIAILMDSVVNSLPFRWQRWCISILTMCIHQWSLLFVSLKYVTNWSFKFWPIEFTISSWMISYCIIGICPLRKSFTRAKVLPHLVLDPIVVLDPIITHSQQKLTCFGVHQLPQSIASICASQKSPSPWVLCAIPHQIIVSLMRDLDGTFLLSITCSKQWYRK